MQKLIVSVLSTAALLGAAASANAQIVMMGDVTNTTLNGLFGLPEPTFSDANRYHYYTFTASAGDTINFSGSRTTGGYDMVLAIYEGDMTGAGFGPGNLSDASLYGYTRVAFADDNTPPAIPGPYGDPAGSIVAGVTGTYTVAIGTALSSPMDGRGWGYTITVSVTPTPGAAAVLGLGGLAATRRRRR